MDIGTKWLGPRQRGNQLSQADGLEWVTRGRSPWRRVGYSRAERQKVLARASGPEGWGPKLKERRGP